MCSQQDDPTQYDVVAPKPPTRIRTAGPRPADTEPRGSVALAVLGEMIQDAEDHARWVRVTVLREARRRVAEAEANV